MTIYCFDEDLLLKAYESSCVDLGGKNWRKLPPAKIKKMFTRVRALAGEIILKDNGGPEPEIFEQFCEEAEKVLLDPSQMTHYGFRCLGLNYKDYHLKKSRGKKPMGHK